VYPSLNRLATLDLKKQETHFFLSGWNGVIFIKPFYGVRL